MKQLAEPSSLDIGASKASFPKMDMASSDATFAKMPDLESGHSDILNMSSMTGDSMIKNTNNISKKDIKKLDSLDLFSNDAAKERKQTKVNKDLKPGVKGIEDVKVAQMEQHIDSIMPKAPDVTMEHGMNLPGLMGNPEDAISAIEKSIDGSSSHKQQNKLKNDSTFDFGGIDFGNFSGFGSAFNMLDSFDPIMDTNFMAKDAQHVDLFNDTKSKKNKKDPAIAPLSPLNPSPANPIPNDFGFGASPFDLALSNIGSDTFGASTFGSGITGKGNS